ncbi:MAG: hypothetical protein QGG40_04265 [Myxococcota bacterium]|nr:hypothetical protein [Myxococcota bacterium]
MISAGIFAFALTLSGCRNDATDTGDVLPGPYIYDDDGLPEPSFDAESVSEAVTATVQTLLTINATPLLQAYHLGMDQSDEGCPTYYDADDLDLWLDDCTAESGASFDGYMYHAEYEDYEASDGVVSDGEAFAGVARITDSDGYTFDASGTVSELIGVGTNDEDVFQLTVSGSFSWDHPGAESTWLADGLSPDLSLYAAHYDSGGLQGNGMYITGGFSGLTGEVTTVYLDEVLIVDELLGTNCEDEPSGTISVRDQDGYWYDVMFDGPTFEEFEVDEETCDGCGSAWFRGEYVGDACVDFSPWLEWDGTPW